VVSAYGQGTLGGAVKGAQQLVATVTPDGEQKFNFKLLGAPASDPGLNFASAKQ
jgi:hypothetical protein